MAVYRVFEALDELGAIVEEARGVPMTAGCVVPRGDVLELIDDIKDAIPGELDDAQDVLDARDSMLHDAKAHAESMVSSATTESESMLNHARAEADRLLSDAKGAGRPDGERGPPAQRADGRGGSRGVDSHRHRGETRVRGQRWPCQSRSRPADRKRQHLLREGRARGHQGTAAPGVAERGRAGRQRGIHPSHRHRARRSPTGCVASATSTSTTSSPSSRSSSTARSVRSGVAATNSAPQPGRTTTRRGSRRVVRPGWDLTLCVGHRKISAMARQHSTTARRHPPSPLAVDITRLGRRPGSMVTLRNTVPSPSRIGRQ